MLQNDIFTLETHRSFWFRRYSEQFTVFVGYVHWSALTMLMIWIVICHIRNGSKIALLAFHFNEHEAKFASLQRRPQVVIQSMFSHNEGGSLSSHRSRNEERACWRIRDDELMMDAIDFSWNSWTSDHFLKIHLRFL